MIMRLAAWLVLGASISHAATDPPHILFIVIDDLGHDDLGFTATAPQIQTPNVDKFAKEGRVLTDYYVQPSCSPTRATIMTGRYPLHTGLNSFIPAGVPYGLALNETTMADVLTGAGYASHAIGKWHLGMQTWKHTPTFRGFQSFTGFYGGGEDYYTHLSQGGYDLRRDRTPSCGSGCSEVAIDINGQYSTNVFSAEAVRVVEAHDPAKPLFLYLAYQAVHSPAESPASYQAPYKAMGLKGTRLIYAGMVAAVDEGIGNVTNALEAKGMLENTIIVLTSDNGGPTETCAIQGSSNWPLRGSKCSLWEGGTRGVSFIWSGRGDLPIGNFGDLMHAADWLPTFADMLGLACPQCNPWDGVSHWQRLKVGADDDDVPAARDHVYYGVTDFQVGHHGPAVRIGCYKLIYGDGGKPGGWAPPPNGTQAYAALDLLVLRDELLREVSAQKYRDVPLPPNPDGTMLFFNVCDDPGEHVPLDAMDSKYASEVAALVNKANEMWATVVPACDDVNNTQCPGWTTNCQQGKPVTINGTSVWDPWCEA